MARIGEVRRPPGVRRSAAILCAAVEAVASGECLPSSQAREEGRRRSQPEDASRGASATAQRAKGNDHALSRFTFPKAFSPPLAALPERPCSILECTSLLLHLNPTKAGHTLVFKPSVPPSQIPLPLPLPSLRGPRTCRSSAMTLSALYFMSALYATTTKSICQERSSHRKAGTRAHTRSGAQALRTCPRMCRSLSPAHNPHAPAPARGTAFTHQRVYARESSDHKHAHTHAQPNTRVPLSSHSHRAPSACPLPSPTTRCVLPSHAVATHVHEAPRHASPRTSSEARTDAFSSQTEGRVLHARARAPVAPTQAAGPSRPEAPAQHNAH
eukprot:5255413-Pleurochrysis_carterae.AAC.3